ncbi:hypothetical protein, partial [Rathayibacter toxicus]
AHNPGAETMAMGRSMPQRVTPYALKNDYGYYKALPDPIWNFTKKRFEKSAHEGLHIWANKKWINYQMRQGKDLVNIGAPDPLLRPAGVNELPTSPYYNMELEQTANYPGYRTDPQPQWNLN